VNAKLFGWLLVVIVCCFVPRGNSSATTVSTSYGISYQANVNAAGQNIVGDAANESSMCIDPTNPNRMAVGWRQFDTVTSNFRQSGVAYTTNGGLNWTFPGDLEPGVFRSDPVLASDANGVFYYLGISNAVNYSCDLLRSTNGGATWKLSGFALGGDKEWMTIDTTSGPGRGNIYEIWSPYYNYTNNENKMFTRSTNGGRTWLDPIAVPHLPYWGTLDVGPNGELYSVGFDGQNFWVNRSTNAQNPGVTPTFDLTVSVNLGGPMLYSLPGINPAGLLGQVWIAADRSSGPTRSNVYVLCSVTNDPGNWANVMFSRSTNGGRTWNPPQRLNDDPATQHACHWFGTLSVAPDGRIDACWNDTRHSANKSLSELYYSWSDDGGRTWAPNRPLSPQFNQSLGYPQQDKMGDYIAMVSLNEGACIAYAATFNGEEDIYFVRAELPILARVTWLAGVARISWNAVPGVSYCVQAIPDLSVPWSAATYVACLMATNSTPSVDDPLAGSAERRFYRIVRQP
jgi:hypothetical protein